MTRVNKCIFVDMINIMNDMDKIKVGTIISNEENCIINMNETAKRFTGWSLEECLGLDLYNVVELTEDESGVTLISKQSTKVKVTIETTMHDYIFGQSPYNVTLIKELPYSSYRNDLIEISENNLRTIFDSTYDAIIIHNLQGNILDVNKKMLEMYKLDSVNQAKLMGIRDLSADNNPFEELPKIWKSVVAGENKLFEWNAKRPSDQSVFEVEVYLVRISLRNQDAIMATIRDISEKKRTQEMIQYLSFHDELTGLYNRAFFEKELLRLDTEGELPISIIMGDVNGLKLANDAFGHLAGDELLKNAADVFRRACRKDDVIARWGGDEFVIILTGTDSKDASRICERIHEECMKVDLKPVILSIGLGHATKTRDLQNVFEIIKEAETAMYANKLKEGIENKQKIINSILTNNTPWDHDIQIMMEFCSALARAYGMEENQVEDIRLLAYIHDIGKASIPPEVIGKAGKLSEEEWVIVKKHSEIGYRITSTYPEYAHLADCILAHHERWDGTGYPRKLRGKEIPIGARILSIVDAYEAMISGRPYKSPLTKAETLNEIELNGGSQFDPELVKLFVGMNK